MAEQFDKIIQNGITSFVPRSNKTRQFWMKQNAKVAGAQNASKETVTIMPATDEEVAEWLKEGVPAKVATIVPVQSTTKALEDLQQQMATAQEQMRQQQELIQQLLMEKRSHVGAEQSTGSTTADVIEKERVKPGPKPKNNTNG